MNQKILLEVKKFKNTPPCFFFTDRRKVSDFADVLRNLPKNSAIIIREYDLNSQEREVFAQEIINLARIYNHRKSLKILVGKDLDLAKKIKADGIHFSDHKKLPTKLLRRKSFLKKFIFSLSCHSFESIRKSQKLNPDIIFISPIFASTSHPGTKPLGLRNLAKFAFQSKSQKYFFSRLCALGGVNHNNIKSLRKLGISGFGAIDLFSKTYE